MGLFDFIKPNIEKIKTNKDIPALIKAIHHSDKDIHNKAIQALSDLKPLVNLIIPQLILEIEKAPQSPIEYYANWRLKIGGDDDTPRYSPINGEKLTERKFPIKDIAGIIEKFGNSAIPFLENAKKTNNKRSLIWINALLAKMSPQNDTNIQYLIDVLEEENTLDFIEAADALGFLGLKAEKAIPALIKIPKKNPLAGWVIVPTLEEIGQSTIPFLLQEISVENNPGCYIYEAALGGVLPAQQNVIELLIKHLQMQNETKENLLNCIFSIGALSKIGPSAKSAIPYLEQVFNYDLIPTKGRRFDGFSVLMGSLRDFSSIDRASYYMNILIALESSNYYSGYSFGKVMDWITVESGLRTNNPYGWKLSCLSSNGIDTGYNLNWGDSFSPIEITFKAISNISGNAITPSYYNEKRGITEKRYQQRIANR